jgi:hypothetical protein
VGLEVDGIVIFVRGPQLNTTVQGYADFVKVIDDPSLVSENAAGAAVAVLATAMTFAPVGASGSAAVRMCEGASITSAASEFSDRIAAGTSVGKNHQILVLRNTRSLLLDDPSVAAAVMDACKQLRARLGLLYSFVAEEATSPDDDEAER